MCVTLCKQPLRAHSFERNTGVCVCVCSAGGLRKTSRNQLQLFSVDNVIKLKAAANTPAPVSYLERTEIYKRSERSVHSKRTAPSGTAMVQV